MSRVGPAAIRSDDLSDPYSLQRTILDNQIASLEQAVSSVKEEVKAGKSQIHRVYNRVVSLQTMSVGTIFTLCVPVLICLFDQVMRYNSQVQPVEGHQ